MRFLYLFIITLLFSSCSQEDNRIIPTVQTFIKLSTATTGITFNNEILRHTRCIIHKNGGPSYRYHENISPNILI